MLLRGIAAVLFGLVVLAVPAAAMLSLVLLFAAYLLVDGLLAMVSAVSAARRRERWGPLLAEGVLDVLMGAVAFFFPGDRGAGLRPRGGRLVAPDGPLDARLGSQADARARPRVDPGLVSILFSLALVVAPLVGALVLTRWLGGYAVAFSVFLLVFAFKLRGQKDRTAGPGTSERTTLPQGAA